MVRVNRMMLLMMVGIALMSAAAQAGLIHRYSFNDGAAKDSVGKVDGVLKGAAKVENGKLEIANGEKVSGDASLSYLEFPSAITPKSGSVSLAIWITAKQNAQFSRVLDIGDAEGSEGRAFIYLVPRHEEDQSRAAITASDTGGKTYVQGAPLDDDKPHLAVLVVDGTANKLHLYVDGKELHTPEDLADNKLESVKPVHSWIGRSGFDADPGLNASIDEFRVYDTALSAADIAEMIKAGPDAVPPTSAPAK